MLALSSSLLLLLLLWVLDEVFFPLYPALWLFHARLRA